MNSQEAFDKMVRAVKISFTDEGEKVMDDGKIRRILNVAEEGHEVNQKAVLDTFMEFIDAQNLHSKIGKVEEHYRKKLRDVILQCVPPFTLMLCVYGAFTAEEFLDSLLCVKEPLEAQIVAHQIPEEKYVDTVFSMYLKMEESRKVVEVGGVKLFAPDGAKGEGLDALLKSYGLPSWGKVLDALSSSDEHIRKAVDERDRALAEGREAKAEISTLSKALDDLNIRASMLVTSTEIAANGEIPAGKVTSRRVSEVFGAGFEKDFEVPFWEWEGPHPHVPAVDPHYIFRQDLLVRVLYALMTNQKMYLHGHTGTGKTTLVEQVAARLNFPCRRMNFDSDITRMDLIGRDTIKDGQSQFVDGMLPQMMGQPCIAIFDELDFVRPDVAYVMQSALEGGSLVLTEDGGRVVKPHPMFRVFATGNTVGQGDEEGMYQGARPQSLALLDRFVVWGRVEYLSPEERAALVKRHFPGLRKEDSTIINKYVDEHVAAFVDHKIHQPISPRGVLALARATLFLNGIKGTKKSNVREALTQVVLDRASIGDRATILGVMDRVCK